MTPPSQEHRCFTSSCHQPPNHLDKMWHLNLQLHLVCQRSINSLSRSQSLKPLGLSPTLKATVTSSSGWNFRPLTCWRRDFKTSTARCLSKRFLLEGINLRMQLAFTTDGIEPSSCQLSRDPELKCCLLTKAKAMMCH